MCTMNHATNIHYRDVFATVAIDRLRQGMKKGDRVALGGEDILVAAEWTAADRKTDRGAFAAVAIDGCWRWWCLKMVGW
ncbi:hypothetical protein Tco_0781079 [Tanacetum coccineum]